MSNRMNDGLRRLLCVLAMGLTGAAAGPWALASSSAADDAASAEEAYEDFGFDSDDDGDSAAWASIVLPDRPDIGRRVPPIGERIPITRPPVTLPPVVIVQPPPVVVPPVSDPTPPTTGAQAILQQAKIEMDLAAEYQAGVSLMVFNNLVAATGPANAAATNKQFCGTARGMCKGHAKDAQVRVKSILNGAKATMKGAGASKEQVKALSAHAKQTQAQIKWTYKGFTQNINGLLNAL